MVTSNWTSLGAPGTINANPTIGKNDDGRLEVFATGLDNALWHIWQVAPNGPWDNWASLGGPPNVDIGHSIGVHVNDDGRLEIFATGSDSALWHIWQVTPNGPWGAWASLGKPPGPVFITTPLVSANDDGRLEAFVIGSDRALWHIWQTAPGAPWGGWASLGGPPTGNMVLYPFLRKNDDGRLEVFVTAEYGALWHMWQLTAGGGWGSWSSLGSPSSLEIGSFTPFVAENDDGRLEAFAVGSDGALWHTWQISPGGHWGS